MQCNHILSMLVGQNWSKPLVKIVILKPLKGYYFFSMIDREATVKKCVFVEDGFKCLRESIFSVFNS